MCAHDAVDRSKTPYTVRGEGKRQRIIEAAAVVLARKGYSGTTLADIAEAAGTQAGSLYYHFASREELAEVVLGAGAQATVQNTIDAVAALPPGVSARERLEAAIMAQVTFTLERSPAALAAARAIGQLPPDIDSKLTEYYRDYGVFLAELFKAAAAEGAIAPDTDLSAARMLVFGAATWTAEWFHPDGSSSAQEIGRLLCRLLFDGLGPQQPKSGSATAKPGGRGRKRSDAA